jgi:hypothetical protein
MIKTRLVKFNFLMTDIERMPSKFILLLIIEKIRK